MIVTLKIKFVIVIDSVHNFVFVTSVRYAVQLLTPANLLARINGKYIKIITK